MVQRPVAFSNTERFYGNSKKRIKKGIRLKAECFVHLIIKEKNHPIPQMGDVFLFLIG
jgi:hypothetical protein